MCSNMAIDNGKVCQNEGYESRHGMPQQLPSTCLFGGFFRQQREFENE